MLWHNPWKIQNGQKCRLDPFGTAQSVLVKNSSFRRDTFTVLNTEPERHLYT